MKHWKIYMSIVEDIYIYIYRDIYIERHIYTYTHTAYLYNVLNETRDCI